MVGVPKKCNVYFVRGGSAGMPEKQNWGGGYMVGHTLHINTVHNYKCCVFFNSKYQIF